MADLRLRDYAEAEARVRAIWEAAFRAHAEPVEMCREPGSATQVLGRLSSALILEIMDMAQTIKEQASVIESLSGVTA